MVTWYVTEPNAVSLGMLKTQLKNRVFVMFHWYYIGLGLIFELRFVIEAEDER